MIISGELDDVPENMFLYKGSIDEVLKKFEESKNK